MMNLGFNGKDVADNLGYQNGSRDINKHVAEDDALKWGVTDSVCRTQQMTIINESSLWRLIMNLGLLVKM